MTKDAMLIADSTTARSHRWQGIKYGNLLNSPQMLEEIASRLVRTGSLTQFSVVAQQRIPEKFPGRNRSNVAVAL